MDEELREELAALAHDQWSGWMKYLFEKCRPGRSKLGNWGLVKNGTMIIPTESVERWQRQMNTPYAELSEAEKESDRQEADRVLALLANHEEPQA